MLDEAQIDRRKPVWLALSELWLDTELNPDDLGRIALVLKTSCYSLAQLREIYRFEVAPVVYLNMMVVTGEWAGFDQKWLFAAAAKRAQRRWSPLRVFPINRIGNWIMTWGTRGEWETIVSMLESGV